MPARLAFLLAAPLLASLALLTAACGGSDGDPPPRNPLDDTATPAPTATPTTPLATATPSGSATPPGDGASAPDERALEAFTGNAIELMAEWLGVPVTDLRVDSAEALVWPNSCIGIAQPRVACAEILTPGFRVVLRDAFDNVHGVHGSTLGQLRWRGETVANGTIAAVDGSSLTIEVDGEVDGEQRLLLASPGTRYDGPEGPFGLDAIEPGLEVAVAFDGSPTGSALPVAAWVLVTSAP